MELTEQIACLDAWRPGVDTQPSMDWEVEDQRFNHPWLLSESQASLRCIGPCPKEGQRDKLQAPSTQSGNITVLCQAWQCTALILTVGKQREGNLVYIKSSRTTRGT